MITEDFRPIVQPEFWRLYSPRSASSVLKNPSSARPSRPASSPPDPTFTRWIVQSEAFAGWFRCRERCLAGVRTPSVARSGNASLIGDALIRPASRGSLANTG